MYIAGDYMDKTFSETQIPTALQGFYSVIQEDLQEVERLLKDFLACDNPFIQQVTEHGFRLGGKRMRPALHLLFAKMAGNVLPAHFVIGAALETIHTASLVHDDILDEAETRRHLPTVNAVWNNETSVLMGDFMVARAMLAVAQLRNQTVNEIVAQTSCSLCEGEMRQVGSRGRFDLTEDEYYEIITGKTAALFECACRLGVLCALIPDGNTAEISAENQKKIENAALFGRSLGQAFQIADDLLDILGTEERMGKTLGSDLAKQKLALPIIRLLAALDAVSRETLIGEIRNRLSSGTYSKIRDLFCEHKICDSVRATTIGHIRQGLELLSVFPESQAKNAIEGFANYAIERQC